MALIKTKNIEPTADEMYFRLYINSKRNYFNETISANQAHKRLKFLYKYDGYTKMFFDTIGVDIMNQSVTKLLKYHFALWKPKDELIQDDYSLAPFQVISSNGKQYCPVLLDAMNVQNFANSVASGARVDASEELSNQISIWDYNNPSIKRNNTWQLLIKKMPMNQCLKLIPQLWDLDLDISKVLKTVWGNNPVIFTQSSVYKEISKDGHVKTAAYLSKEKGVNNIGVYEIDGQLYYKEIIGKIHIKSVVMSLLSKKMLEDPDMEKIISRHFDVLSFKNSPVVKKTQATNTRKKKAKKKAKKKYSNGSFRRKYKGRKPKLIYTGFETSRRRH
jgi:hypothetical protein